LDVIKTIAEHVPEAIVGAGTVSTPAMLQDVVDAGGQFAISPGLTPRLLDAGQASTIPLIPGIATVSELMTGLDHGYETFKFFPAEASGGVNALKSLIGPFPHVNFCPTGGISPKIYNDYLAIPNVKCVGGSWMVPSDAVASEDWDRITALATAAVNGVVR
jgi:2-dehydro-3-deoxyphosphogluconate aldolase/(4S)-4-hydroxy-2-oxoglutarate aldolase